MANAFGSNEQAALMSRLRVAALITILLVWGIGIAPSEASSSDSMTADVVGYWAGPVTGDFPAARAEEGEVEPAQYVGYASFPVDGSVDLALTCEAPPGQRMSEDVIATAVDDGSHQNQVFVWVNSHRTTGEWIGIGDTEHVWREREDDYDVGAVKWTASGGINAGPGNHIGRIAWAVWGARPTCSLTVGGDPVAVRSGGFALYAPPQAFGGGVYYQDDDYQWAVGRVFEHAASGGPLFAAMSTTEFAVGTFVTTSPGRVPVARECQRPNRSACIHFAVPEASEFKAILEADPLGGRGVSQLWMISLPPES